MAAPVTSGVQQPAGQSVASHDTSATATGFLAAAVALLLVGGAMAAFIQISLASEPARATGTVVDFVHNSGRYSSSDDPLVQFTTAGGETRQVESWLPAAPGLPDHVGQKVPVAYDPADPNRAAIDTFAESWVAPIGMAACGLITLMFGLAALLFRDPKAAALDQAA